MTEEKSEIKQIEEFAEELSDEALDRVKEREESTCWVPCVNLSNA